MPFKGCLSDACVLMKIERFVLKPLRKIERFVLKQHTFRFADYIIAASTSVGSFVRMPVSKFLLCPLFMPIPAPVKFAEPM